MWQNVVVIAFAQGKKSCQAVRQHVSGAHSLSELRRACAVGRLHENKVVRAELERALLGDQPQECHFFVALDVDEVCDPIIPVTCQYQLVLRLGLIPLR